jgi:lantibiotic biosynthesis protein
MSEPTSWTPILPPATADRALEVAAEIAADLRDASDPQRGPSLAGGDAGFALLYTYLNQALPGRDYDETAMERLERAIELTSEIQTFPSLYSGFSGVAWTLEHLRGRLFEDSEEEDPGDDVASALVEHLSLSPWRGDYDLISGLVGYGIYALERMPRPGGRECLERVVARLAETVERLPRGITWRTTPDLMIQRDRDLHPEGNYNLGLAHGVPGVIGLLALAQAAGVECRDLLDGAVAWLLSCKLPADAGSFFAYNEDPAPSQTEIRSSRLAWCYGDLGIAASLLVAARALGEEGWQRQALEIARSAAQRTQETSGIVDAGICHGAAGAAHIFNRLYQETGDPILREAALTWFDRSLDSFRQGEGYGGYLMYIPDETTALDWRKDPGFLTGSAGVGLALLAAATPVAPEWDRTLLISARS